MQQPGTKVAFLAELSKWGTKLYKEQNHLPVVMGGGQRSKGWGVQTMPLKIVLQS